MGRGAATSPLLHGSQLRGRTGSGAVGKGVLSRCHAAPHPSPHPILGPAIHPALFCCPQDRLTAMASVYSSPQNRTSDAGPTPSLMAASQEPLPSPEF